MFTKNVHRLHAFEIPAFISRRFSGPPNRKRSRANNPYLELPCGSRSTWATTNASQHRSSSSRVQAGSGGPGRPMPAQSTEYGVERRLHRFGRGHVNSGVLAECPCWPKPPTPNLGTLAPSGQPLPLARKEAPRRERRVLKLPGPLEDPTASIWLLRVFSGSRLSSLPDRGLPGPAQTLRPSSRRDRSRDVRAARPHGFAARHLGATMSPSPRCCLWHPTMDQL